jgi:hypothetical protein
MLELKTTRHIIDSTMNDPDLTELDKVSVIAHAAIRHLRTSKQYEPAELRHVLLGIAHRADEAADDFIDAIQTAVKAAHA